jgi:small-conductance mechanosensitive channel
MLVAGVDISESLQQGLDDLFGFIPKLIGFLIILLIGYLVAKALQKIVALALEKVGTDNALRSGATGEYVRRVAPDTSPSQVIGLVVFWFILLGALSIAISALGIAALNDFIANVFNYLPNVIAAILILVVAIALAGWLTQLITRSMGETTMSKVMSTAVPSLVLGIAVFMVLDQLGIAAEIVTITYAALLGAIALGLALAFGLGGRDLASRMLEDTYQRGREERERYRAERGETPSGPATTSTAPMEHPGTSADPRPDVPPAA